MIILTDCDGTVTGIIVQANEILTSEMRANLDVIYQGLIPFSWCHGHYIFKARVFILHTGRDAKYNSITRQWFYYHFGLEHFRIVNVPFISHEKYVANKVRMISDLMEEWLDKREYREEIKVIDDDLKIIGKVYEKFEMEDHVRIFTIQNERLVNYADLISDIPCTSMV